MGATIVALDAPIVATSKPARTALVWMLLVSVVAMFFSVTFADLAWWLWGAMLLWTDVFLQLALSLSLVWIFRLDSLRHQAGKKSKFSSVDRCCYGVFTWTTLAPLSYAVWVHRCATFSITVFFFSDCSLWRIRCAPLLSGIGAISCPTLPLSRSRMLPLPFGLFWS